MHTYYVYMLTDVKRNVMYVGVTSNLENRVAEHGDGRGGAFTRKYRLNTLVHVEESTKRLLAKKKSRDGGAPRRTH
jgi:putative endonuclease